MPAPKHTQDTQEDDPVIGLDNDQKHCNQKDDKEDPDQVSRSIQGEKNENVTIMLSDIREIVQCPICLGIIRKTRTVMDCLHRFCRECIDKSMRLGNKECPACRTHCASRRSLRDDKRYDAFIASLYPDIDKYEEEELAFQEEEKARNVQIQASIAQAAQRQTESLSRKRSEKATAVALRRRSSNCRNVSPRRRRDSLVSADFLREYDDNEDANGEDSSSDEKAENEQKKCKRLGGALLSQSSGALSVDGVGDGNDPELNKEFMDASPGFVGSSDGLSWRKGDIQSQGDGKNSGNSRILKLVDHLQNSQNNDDEWNIHIRLVSFDKQSIPSLKLPYLCGSLTLSVSHLCEYVARQTALEASEVEICFVEELAANNGYFKSVEELTFVISMSEPGTDKVVVLREQDTLAEVEALKLFQPNLVLVYRKKLETDSTN